MARVAKGKEFWISWYTGRSFSFDSSGAYANMFHTKGGQYDGKVQKFASHLSCFVTMLGEDGTVHRHITTLVESSKSIDQSSN